MKAEILKHLGYSSDSTVDSSTDILVDKAINEVIALSGFRYVYACFEQSLDFMTAHSAYGEYLSGAKQFLLCATTLGISIDRKMKRLQLEDMTYALIFDAVASVYIEQQADAYERKLPYTLGFRFCPGYRGTPLSDNVIIANTLHAEKIGISFLDSGLMLPMKSMTGIIRIGDAQNSKFRKTCDRCVAREKCTYRAKGTYCFH